MRTPFGLGLSLSPFGKIPPLSGYIREGNMPPLVSDFEAGKYGINGVGKLLGGVVPSFTRASSATYRNSDGNLSTAAVNEIRIDYDPVTGSRLGMMIEPAATNLVVTPAAPATQTITVVDATVYTLHFTGTGSITLTGASTSGPLVGTGAGEANRVSLTLTTAGTGLTLTMSGAVVNAQLEINGAATSFIDGTRAKDIPSILTSGFGFADGFAGTLIMDWTKKSGSLSNSTITEIHNGASNYILATHNPINNSKFKVNTGGSLQVDINSKWYLPSGVRAGKAITWAANDFALSLNGAAVKTDAIGSLPTGLTALNYGMDNFSGAQLNGWLHSLVYHDARLTNAELVRASAL